jgi:hypothetical protein
MTSTTINTMKIYEVNEHTIEDDYHTVTYEILINNCFYYLIPLGKIVNQYF